jgi:hypothetical protein
VIDFAQALDGATWFDVIPRTAACPHVSPFVLLHAGPPYSEAVPAPVLNCAVQALLYEGLAGDAATARRLLAERTVRLEPAQDHGVATPLAQVVSASMMVFSVRLGSEVRHGAMLEGAAPALRFGSAAPSCRDRLRLLGDRVSRDVAPFLRRQPVELAGIVRAAVAAGDDCHARTGHAHDALLAQLSGVTEDTLECLRGMPAFGLPIFMAAALAALQASGEVAAIGGNGIDFGLRRRGAAAWRRVGSRPPAGTPLPGCAALDVLPAIGDSVVVDFCGLGGQVDSPAVRAALIDPKSGVLDAERIASGAGTPVFNLAMLDLNGEAGLVGRGCYSPPMELFQTARPQS